MIELEDNLTQLTLAPDVGGSLVNWTVRATGQPLLRPSDEAALNTGLPGKLACYPLAPWSNRVAQGGFDNPGGWLALTPNSPLDPLPIHGSAWQQVWQVVRQTADEVVLEVVCETPFAYRAEQRLRLSGGELSIQLRVTHLAEKAAWHGLGLHPYLPRRPGTRLQAKADQVWMSDASKLPTGLAPVPAEWDFTQLKGLPHALVDNGFCQWDGRCRIEQPELGYALECQASGADYFLLFCPPGLGFFCIEPVSHPVNAHHLPGRPGLKLLEQGQSTQLDFKLKYIPTVGAGLLAKAECQSIHL
ncbi:aldose 1-epimerase [Pseudomonas salomonii]|uniref:Aldose 1-epimerase n=1 Tax=Pseudomonas salomonii TaxID=191391 RepID=A0A1H3P5P6_9PSED|nr:aldose 1-epimerase [Pseudomonas salomonii]SDY96391.1 aldose 1-epimerase [Pseudomonas salomonii]